MKLLEVEGGVHQCPIAGHATAHCRLSTLVRPSPFKFTGRGHLLGVWVPSLYGVALP